MATPRSKKLVVCIDNEGYPASLEKRKIYFALRDPGAEKHGLVRVIDESGDDYLYPKMFFRSIALPQAIKKAVLAAALPRASSARSTHVESRTRSRLQTWSHFLPRVKKGGNMEKHDNKLYISLLTRLKRFFLIFLFVYLALYVLVYLLLFVMQRHLLFPTHIANASRLGTPADYYLSDFNETALIASDGVKIEGWDHAPRKDMPVILYFHGNGENIAARAERYEAFAKEGYGVFALEYRGYGNNEGSPSEEGLYKDARAARAWVGQAYPSAGIILYGESLGSGVAGEMAKEQRVFGVVMQSAYTSIPNRVEEVYWFLPGIKYLVRDRFDSLSKIAGIHSPILIIHGGRDGVVPISHGEKLAKAATARKEFVVVPDAGHMDIPDSLIVSAMKKFFVAQATNKEPAHE